MTNSKLKLVIFGLLVSACASAPPPPQVPLQNLGHMQSVAVKVNGSTDAQLFIDTGSGVNIITTALCKKIGCKTSGSYTGQRMSGQSLKVPMSVIPAIGFADQVKYNVKAGVIDLENAPGTFGHIDGFLSLNFFEHTPVTIDYQKNILILETPDSIKKRRKSGKIIPLIIDRDHENFGAFILMTLPDGSTAKLEVDTGSDSLILDEKYMARWGFKKDDPTLKKVVGKDETNHTYTRYFGQLQGGMNPVSADEFQQMHPQVMFQKIIYDGLIGYSFFKNFIVTYDLANSQMILNKP